MVSKKVFVASDGLVAFIDRGHPKHMQVSACFRYFAQNSYQLFTTVVMLNEVYFELYMSISPSVARDFMRAVELSALNILYPEESDCKKSLRTVITSQSVDLTFSKALMAIICNKRSIPQILTFDYMPTLFGLQAFYLPV
jgi:predicted nucleic acid-binding protein